MCKQKKAWFEIGWFDDIGDSIAKLWPYVLIAAVILFMVGCSPKPTCTEQAMAEWREKNPKGGSAEAAYRYRRFQQECGETDG